MVRIILLRLLISWWMIPAVWTLVFAIGYLLSGYNETKDVCIELTKVLWSGEVS